MKLTSTRYGQMVYPARDAVIGPSLERYGEWSQLELAFLQRHLKPNDNCLDVGAHLGTHTLFFATYGGTVWSIEPQKFIYELLLRNLALNHITNVRSLHAAAGAHPGIAHMPRLDYTAAKNFGGVQACQEGEEVAQIAIDTLEIPALALLKIDVEGAEPEVLLGAQETLRRCQPLLYIEYYPERHSQDLVQLLHSLDYKVYKHSSPSFNPHNFKNNQDNFFGDYLETNLFCVPQ